MAFTRKMLKALSLTDEQIESIMEAHAETVDALKSEVQRAKADAETVADLQKQLKEALEKADKADEWKAKHDSIQNEFNGYKDEQSKRATRDAKVTAYAELLKQAGVSEKHIKTVLKVSDVDSIELEDGKVKNSDELTATIKDEWSDFIPTVEEQGAQTQNPPANSHSGMSKADIMAIKDAGERQKAIAENAELFGI